MIRTISLVVLSAGFTFPQSSNPLTPEEVLAATRADLRGLSEGRTTVQFSVLGAPGMERSSVGTISAKRLRHRPPRAARQAYEKATRSKDRGKAMLELEKAVALDPDYAEAHMDLGVIYARQGRYPDAASELRRAIELAPDESLPHSNLAWVQFASGQLADARASVRRAIQLSPDNAHAHMLMGRLLIDTPETVAEGLWHLEYAARTIPELKRMLKVLKGE